MANVGRQSRYKMVKNHISVSIKIELTEKIEIVKIEQKWSQARQQRKCTYRMVDYFEHQKQGDGEKVRQNEQDGSREAAGDALPNWIEDVDDPTVLLAAVDPCADAPTGFDY